ncbi:MAG TPA: magnesium/cobalt transporter CorA [Anaerolineae bacterium]|nr:magnesium/cobalt transporter CorA [Anaerolineae bacterium]
MHFDEEHFVEYETSDIEACLNSIQQPGVTWLNVAGLHDSSLIEMLGEKLGLHPLVLEDIANTSQRPKVENYEIFFFIVLKMLEYEQTEGQVQVEQVSLVLGENYLLSFQEDESDVFDPVRTRLRNGAGRLRKRGPDYLAYSLIDAVIDNYFIILEQVGDEIEAIEEQVSSYPEQRPLPEIYRLKREMIALRRAVWPLREVIATLQHSESPLIQSGTVIYLRDVYDHTIQIMDTVESMRDLLSGMLDVYLSVLSNRMNEIMKVLTVFSTIFIPLTFLAGVYGMNFRHFPEIDWPFGYAFFWLICGVVAIFMLLYYRRKRWL